MSWWPKQSPRSGVPASTIARMSTPARSIHGACSVTLWLEPVMKKASASRGPGSGASVRRSCVAQVPGQAAPVRSSIQRGKPPRRSAMAGTVSPVTRMRARIGARIVWGGRVRK